MLIIFGERFWLLFGGEWRLVMKKAQGSEESSRARQAKAERHKTQDHKHKKRTGFNAGFRNPCMQTLKLKLRTSLAFHDFPTAFAVISIPSCTSRLRDCATFYGRQRHPSLNGICGETAITFDWFPLTFAIYTDHHILEITFTSSFYC